MSAGFPNRNVSLSADQWVLLNRFVDQLLACRDSGALCELVSTTTGHFGSKYFVYYSERQGNSSPTASPHHLTSLPREWVVHYQSRNYGLISHWRQAARRSNGPVVWSEVTARTALTPEQADMVRDAALAGIVDGVTIPFRPLSGRDFSYLSLAVRGDQEDAVPLILKNAPLLRVIANLIHARATDLLRGYIVPFPSFSLLSPRQRQVLQWIADGKTDWEVARILGVSEKAVKFHIAGARRKLDAVNRTHAVAKSLAMGIIAPPQSLVFAGDEATPE